MIIHILRNENINTQEDFAKISSELHKYSYEDERCRIIIFKA